MVVHPGSGNYDGTLLNGIAWHLQQNAGVDIEKLPRFGLVHRIDKNTSGLFGAGQNRTGHAAFG
jgi:ribosomal large subunit pseudouridine synthase D (EC 5.4.99.-)